MSWPRRRSRSGCAPTSDHQLGEQLGTTERELGVDMGLERRQARLLEAAERLRGERLVLEVGERAAAP